MSENLNEHVVIAFFDDQDAVDGAAKALMDWDEANDDVKLGVIGCITLKEDGDVAVKQYGATNTGRGALLGGVLGLVAAGVTGGLSLIVGAAGGGLIGGTAGKLAKGKLGLSEETVAEVKQHLQGGGAGLAVLCDDFEVDPTIAELTQLGGKAQSFGVSTKVLDAIQNNKAESARWDTTTGNIERSI